MSTTAFDEVRRRLIESGVPQSELEATVKAGEPVWDTKAMTEEFECIGFMAPFVVVKRRSDGVKGTLTFTHSPRFYFDFAPDEGGR
jgi:hypothetical protein